MIQDPLTVSHQQREKKMFDGKLNTQREDSIFLTLIPSLSWFEHCFHLDHWMQEFPNGVFTVLKVYLFTRIFQHMFQGLLIARSRLQTRISRSHDCGKMFQVFQTLTFAWNNSTEAFASWSSASPHSDVTVRFLQSDTRAIERASRRVHSTWVSGDSTRLHADFTMVVTPSVTVDFVSMFLLRCPGKSDFRSRQVGSTQCTQFAHETGPRASCGQLHHLIIAPSTHHKAARNSHVVTSRTAQSNLSRFQQWLTQTLHVFLSTRVHDHLQQVTRSVIREIGVVANRQSVQRESRNITD